MLKYFDKESTILWPLKARGAIYSIDVLTQFNRYSHYKLQVKLHSVRIYIVIGYHNKSLDAVSKIHDDIGYAL